MARTFACLGVSTPETTENQVQEIMASGFRVEPHRIASETILGSVAISQRPEFAMLGDTCLASAHCADQADKLSAVPLFLLLAPFPHLGDRSIPCGVRVTIPLGHLELQQEHLPRQNQNVRTAMTRCILNLHIHANGSETRMQEVYVPGPVAGEIATRVPKLMATPVWRHRQWTSGLMVRPGLNICSFYTTSFARSPCGKPKRSGSGFPSSGTNVPLRRSPRGRTAWHLAMPVMSGRWARASASFASIMAPVIGCISGGKGPQSSSCYVAETIARSEATSGSRRASPAKRENDHDRRTHNF